MFSDCCNSNPGVGLLPGNSGGHSTIINGDQLTNTGSTSQNIQSQRESKGSDVITAQPPFFANVNINYRLPIKVYYRICTLIHIRIEIKIKQS
jgi:hypothetical protein